MAITKLASAVPAPQGPSGLTLLASAFAAPPTLLQAKVVNTGVCPDLSGRLNANAQFLELLARYGAIGVYGIAYGLGLTDVSGLTASVAAGHAYVGSIVEYEADSLTMFDDAVNYVWAKNDRTFEVIADSLTPPTEDATLIGIVTTVDGDISTAIDYSGVVYLKGNLAIRETADVDWPSDTPDAGIPVVTKTLNGTWQWNGASHVRMGGTVAEYGKTSIALSDANYTLSAAEYKYKVIEFTGALTADRDIVLPNVAGAIWVINNKTTGSHKIKPKVSGQTGVSIQMNYAAMVYGNGTDIVTGTLTTEFIDGSIETSAEAA